jgi:hypothetical protein
VIAVAGVAAYESYWHAYAVIQIHGESGVTARLEPATINGLVYASSMVIMYATRHRLPVRLTALRRRHQLVSYRHPLRARHPHPDPVPLPKSGHHDAPPRTHVDRDRQVPDGREFPAQYLQSG